MILIYGTKLNGLLGIMKENISLDRVNDTEFKSDIRFDPKSLNANQLLVFDWSLKLKFHTTWDALIQNNNELKFFHQIMIKGAY